MADAILDYVTRYQGVSFAEVERNIEGFVGGDVELRLPKTNIVLWQGLTEEGVNAFNLRRTGKHIHPDPCPVMAYLVDGMIPKLPVAKGIDITRSGHALFNALRILTHKT